LPPPGVNMNRRIETRVVDTGGVLLNTLIDQDASEVWWITVAPQASKTAGLIQIYDGYDVNGKLKWQWEPEEAKHANFVPPIHCEQGVFVYNDTHIASYTIAWRPKKWSRPPTHAGDTITPP